MPVEAATAAATRVWTMGWPMSTAFRARTRLRGLRLVATDTDWSAGDGAIVEGPVEALLLLLTGRAGLARPAVGSRRRPARPVRALRPARQGEHVEARLDVAPGRADGGPDPLVAGTLEVVQPGPVRGQVGRLQDLHVDRRTGRVEDHRRIAEGGTPARLEETSVHGTGEPAAAQRGDVVVVGAAGRQAAVGREPVVCVHPGDHPVGTAARATAPATRKDDETGTVPIS